MSEDAHRILTLHLERLLSARAFPKTICPSEVARALDEAELKASGADHWRELMPQIRDIAYQMSLTADVEILQKGEPVRSGIALEDIRGPIRVRRTQV